MNAIGILNTLQMDAIWGFAYAPLVYFKSGFKPDSHIAVTIFNKFSTHFIDSVSHSCGCKRISKDMITDSELKDSGWRKRHIYICVYEIG